MTLRARIAGLLTRRPKSKAKSERQVPQADTDPYVTGMVRHHKASPPSSPEIQKAAESLTAAVADEALWADWVQVDGKDPHENGKLPDETVKRLIAGSKFRQNIFTRLFQAVLLSILAYVGIWSVTNLGTLLVIGTAIMFWIGIIAVLHQRFLPLMIMFYMALTFTAVVFYALPYRMWRKQMVVIAGNQVKMIGRILWIRGADEYGQPFPSFTYGIWYGWRFASHVFGKRVLSTFIAVLVLLAVGGLFTWVATVALPLAFIAGIVALLANGIHRERLRIGGYLWRWPHERPNPHEIPYGTPYYLLGDKKRGVDQYRYAVLFQPNTVGLIRRRFNPRWLFTSATMERGVFITKVMGEGANFLDIPVQGDDGIRHMELTFQSPTYIERQGGPYKRRVDQSLVGGSALVEKGVGADAALAKEKSKRFVLPSPEKLDEAMNLDDWES